MPRIIKPLSKKFRSNEAACILLVFYALLELAEKNNNQTPKKIRTVLQDRISVPTIKHVLKSLIKWKAIALLEEHGSTRDKVTRYSNFDPNKIPARIYKQTIPISTLHRWKTRNSEIQEGFGRYDSGIAVMSAEKFARNMPEEFWNHLVKDLQKKETSKTQVWDIDKAQKRFLGHLDGKPTNLDPQIFEIFHRFLNWKTQKLYGET